jgi:hypothetical protein
MRIAILLLACALAASAQSYSSHSGWSFTDTLQSATDVLVADIGAGSAADNGSEVTVKATLHVVRVLSGSINPAANLPIEWRYRPSPVDGPAVTTKVPQARGLWFLRKNSDGAFEPLRAGGTGPMGDVFLPLGASAPAYVETEPLQSKVAREIGAALEELVAEHAADLAPSRPQRIAWSQPRAQYQSLAMALQSLDRTAATDVYQSLSMLPDANLKALGIFGRLGAGDVSAVFELEKNLATVISANRALTPFPLFLGSIDVSKNLVAAHVLARIALSDPTIQGMDGQLAFTLARTRSLEMLPYLVVLLGSPQPGIRDSALAGFCQLLGPMPSPPSALWNSEMAGYCPNATPINDREIEQNDMRFWTEWWDSHREEIAKTVTLPTVIAPARYSAAERRQPAEIPPEVRFGFLLGMVSAPAPDHYHAADGSIVAASSTEAEGPQDPVTGQFSPEDRAIFHQVIDSVNAKLAALQTRSRRMMDAARIAGTMPDREQFKVLSADHDAAMKTGLADLEAKLSPEGWQIVERFLKDMHGIAVGGMLMGPPQ